MTLLAANEESLWRVGLTGLERFYLPQAGILARKLVWDGAAANIVPEPSPRYSIEMLRALYLLRQRGIATVLDADAMLDRLVAQYLPEVDYSDLAQLISADVSGGRRHLDVLWRELKSRLPRAWEDAQLLELSWTLAALCQLFPVTDDPDGVARLAGRLYRKLARRQVASTGLFFGSRVSRVGARGNVVTVPAISYALHALAQYGRVFAVREAISRAEDCASTMARLQGPEGQWWWSYRVRQGEVAVRYPVYSVSQDSSMPMALEALHLATGHRNYAENITRGLNWVLGQNELGTSLLDEGCGATWQCIAQESGELQIVKEMQSYHPARCLYWLATYRLDAVS